MRQSSVIIYPLRSTYELCCVRNVCCRINPLQVTLSYFHLGIIGLMVYGLSIFLHRMKHGGNRWSGTVKTLRMYPVFGSFSEKREHIFDLSFIDTSINLLLTYFLSLFFSLIFFL